MFLVFLPLPIPGFSKRTLVITYYGFPGCFKMAAPPGWAKKPRRCPLWPGSVWCHRGWATCQMLLFNFLRLDSACSDTLQ